MVAKVEYPAKLERDIRSLLSTQLHPNMPSALSIGDFKGVFLFMVSLRSKEAILPLSVSHAQCPE